MNIENLIKRECRYLNDTDKNGNPSASQIHDRAYEKALRRAHSNWANIKDESIIRMCLGNARRRYRLDGSTHQNVADCMFLTALLDELEKGIVI